MSKVYRLILFTVLIYCSSPVYARHILGGNFELNYTGPNGYFDLKLNLFFDKANRPVNVSDNNYAVAIYQKSNNKLMRSLVLSTSQLEGVPFVYTNEKCAASQGLNVAVISYYQNVYLDPNLYKDPQGYYIVWDRCCRNSADNIVNPLGAGMLFYLEFPPLKDASGTDFKNSSPQFVTPNGEYICAGQPFKFDNSATDADGDQLRYSLVTPYNGFSNTNNAAPNPQPSSNYPKINWVSGYDENTAIPSNPAMTIDVDGIIRVTSNQLGLYVFSVEVEELRNGVVIGRVRRDFQLKVINCQVPPTIPVVYKDLDPLKTQLLTVDFCINGFVEIATKNDPDFQFQWQKDNLNIADGDSYKLKVTESGEYTVVISYKQGCSGSSTSGKVIVTEKPGDKFKVVGESEICYTPTGTPLQIAKEDGTAFGAGGYLYLWTRNVTDTIPVKNVFIQATKTGKYVARMTQISGICQYELPKELTVNQLPEATLTNPTGKKVVCEGDSIPLRANSNNTYIYDWQRNSVSVQKSPNDKFPAIASGIYKFEVTDGNKCKNTSDTVKLTFNPLTPVKFDTIFPACGTGNNRINLTPYVQPYDAVKGVFSGRGVSGTTYSPLLAGFGPSPIVYEYTNQYNCTTKKSRIAFVELTPKVRLGDDITIFKGDTVTLKSSISGGYNKDLTLNWSPSYALSSSTISRPLASPDITTKYILSATALSSNCTNQDTIVVIVKTRIQIPTAFTPDDDPSKLNEKWVLEGIEDYPEAEVKIFNRWGGEIFTTKNYQSNPFDGKKDNANLPTGTYYYIIKTGDTVPTLTGYVTIVR
jgi:gliding motility-associated-like protein